MGLEHAAIVKLFSTYPAALDMSPSTVISHLHNLAALFELQPAAAVDMAVKYPPVLGLRPDTVRQKVQEILQVFHQLSGDKVRSMVIGYPNLLGLSSATLRSKWERLMSMAQRRPEWLEQLQRCPAKSLGRVCGSGHRALDKAEYFLAAEQPIVDANGVEYSITTLLIMSKDRFMQKFPEYALWRVQQSKRQPA